MDKLLGEAKQRLKTNENGTLVRTQDGRLFRERIGADLKSERVEVSQQTQDFFIEGAPDPHSFEIIENLFLGSQDAAVNVEELKEKKISYILNVATGIKNAFPDIFQYHSVAILDVEETEIILYFEECFQFIDLALRNSGSVLVHCNAGVSRSASIVIGYLMKTRRLSFQKAHDLVKEKRPKIQPNRGFVEQLKKYEQTVK